MGHPLSYEERKIFCGALSKKSYASMETWNSLANCPDDNDAVNNLMEKVEQEIIEHCDTIIEFLNDNFIERDENIEAIAQYKCNKASTYICKIVYMPEETRDKPMRKCQKFFEEAMNSASSLHALHLLEFGLLTSFLFFY